MKSPRFSEGVLVALIAAFAAGLGQPGLALIFGSTLALGLLVTLGSLAYLLYLLSRAKRRAGRSLVIAAWLLATIGLWALAPSAALFGLAYLGLAWVTRALFIHTRPLPALLDLGLTGLSLVAGIGAWLHSGNLFLAVWTLFLVQALYVWLPGARTRSADPDLDDRFEQAHRRAEAAVRKLITQH